MAWEGLHSPPLLCSLGRDPPQARAQAGVSCEVSAAESFLLWEQQRSHRDSLLAVWLLQHSSGLAVALKVCCCRKEASWAARVVNPLASAKLLPSQSPFLATVG